MHQQLVEIRDKIIVEGQTSLFQTAVLQLAVDGAKTRYRVALPLRLGCASMQVTRPLTSFNQFSSVYCYEHNAGS